MPAKSPQTESDGFTAAERAAMKQRAAELRAEGKKGARKADELQGLFENLFSLENQILNLFVAREREADRYIFTD